MTGVAGELSPSLLLDDVETFETQLEKESSVAVVGPPFAGREAVLDHAQSVLDADRVQLTCDTDVEQLTSRLGDGPLVVDHCQQLYRRQIGGFEKLEKVLNALARTDATVVTGWNSYAWSYLDAVHAIEDTFESVELRSLSTSELTEFVRSQTTARPTFSNDQRDESVLTSVEVTWRDRTVPVPALDSAALKHRLRSSIDPEEAVFSRLNLLASGNPGVALAVYRQLSDEEIRPSDIELPSVELDHESAFSLYTILAGETIDWRVLQDRFGDNVDRVLSPLIKQGIVTVADDETVSLTPRGVPVATETTERRQIL